MKVPKKIEKLIKARMECAEKLSSLDSEVRTWLKENNVDSNELESSYGCMITTEPCAYATMTLELILKAEVD